MASRIISESASPFLSLPTELLQSIAALCPCSTILNLILVNRALHDACNDRLVFRHIAESAHRAIQSSPSQWPEGAAYLSDASLADTIRAAYAAERSLGMPNLSLADYEQNHGKFGEIEVDIFNWIPQFIALRHPATIQIHPLYFLDQFQLARRASNYNIYELTQHSSPEEIAAHYFNTAFCLAYAMIAWTRTKHNIDILHSFADQLRIDGVRRPVSTGSNDPRRVQDFFRTSVQALHRIDEFGPEHEWAALFLLITLIMSANPGSSILPLVDRIPFHTFMNIPPVYRNTGDVFRKCHLQKMCTPEFLSGEWMGFYSDHRWQGPRLDPIMHTIRLDGSWQDEQKGNISIDYTSGGADAHGRFRLEGAVNTDGKVTMAKTYIEHPWKWEWIGHVTPFGIVGTWGGGSRGAASFGGFLWIWKKEWCE